MDSTEQVRFVDLWMGLISAAKSKKIANYDSLEVSQELTINAL